MKAKNAAQLIFTLFMFSVLLTSCYRKKIPVDNTRAEQQLISIEQAKQYQQKFIATRTELSRFVNDTSFLKNRFNLSNSESFNRDMIALLLNQEGADGIRIYFGQDDKGNVKLVLLPVDKNGKDIINHLSGTAAINVPGISPAYADGGGNQAGENGQACPPCTIP